MQLLGVAATLCTLLMACAAIAENRIALVIGNADYRHERLLSTPRSDAAMMGRVFADLGFDVTHVEDLNELAFGEVLSDFAHRAAEADIAIFYYSGHGMEVDGTNYLIPTDARLQNAIDASLHAIELDVVLKAVANARKLSLVILDACRHNLFGDGKGTVFGGMGETIPLPAQVIAYSTSPNALAYEGDGNLSPYTRALAERLIETPEEDVRLLFSSLAERTQRYAKRSQIPYVEIGSFPEGLMSLAIPAAFASPKLVADARPVQETASGILDWDLTGLTFEISDDVLNLSMPEKRDAPRDASIFRPSPALSADTEYQVRFRARAEEPRLIGVSIAHSDDPVARQTEANSGDSSTWSLLGARRFQLGPDWRKYEFSFVSSMDTASAQMSFHLGGSDVNVQLAQIEFGQRTEEIAENSPWQVSALVGDVKSAGSPPVILKDCDVCPEIIPLPGGTFRRGTLDDKRPEREGPVLDVIVSPFGLGRTEVTVDEFETFVIETGRTPNSCWIKLAGEEGWEKREDVSWEKPSFAQEGDHPVVCVSWEDALKYTEWLNIKVGWDLFRLPTEAEWEYAARAGSEGSYYEGFEVSPKKARYLTHKTEQPGTVAVEALDAANPWGLRHMLGNVFEWTADCYLDTLQNARADSQPAGETEGANCSKRPLRGGSMVGKPWGLNVTNRYGEEIGDRLYMTGFRVARDLK